MLKSFAFKKNGVCSHTGELYGFFMYDISPLSGFPGGLVVKNLPANVGDVGSIPGSGRSPGEGNGNLLQYSCLKNPMDRGAWQAAVHGVAKESDTTYKLNNNIVQHLNYISQYSSKIKVSFSPFYTELRVL